MDINWNKFLQDKSSRDIKVLFLQLIYVLEDMVADGRMGDEEFQRQRKRILDNGNNTIRSINSQIDEFEIRLKQNNKEQGND